MPRFVKYVLLAEAFAVATFGVGWWTVPIIAALWGLFSPDLNRARNAAISAAGGWATLLVLDFMRGPVWTMATQLGGVMSLPPSVLILLTLIFPAVLAWSAATVVPRLKAAPTAARS